MDRKSHSNRRNHDGIWKRIIKQMFPEFITYFMPEIYHKIDFAKEPEFLDKELDAMNQAIAGAKGRRIADALIKVHYKGGKAKILILHIEVQISREPEFEYRMFLMYCRIVAQYMLPIEPIAIFPTRAYKHPPNTYTSKGDCHRVEYTYKTYTVREEREAEILQSENPFALAELAYIRANKSTYESVIRTKFLKELLKLLLEKNYSTDYIYCLFLFILTVVSVPERNRRTVLQSIPSDTKHMFILEAPELEFMNRLVKEAEGRSLDEIKKEMEELKRLKLAEQKRREEEAKQRKEAEAKLRTSIIGLYKMNFTAEQIAQITSLELAFVQQIIQSYNK